MVEKTAILKNLNALDRLHRKPTSAKNGLFYSKLALIELCGWIEVSMDDIISKCAKRNLKKRSNLKFSNEQIVGKTFGFEYNKHFRSMLRNLIGLIQLEKLEKKVDSSKFHALKSTLGTLKAARNNQAHTYIRGVTITLNAPSTTIRHFSIVYEGLKEFEQQLKKMGQ